MAPGVAAGATGGVTGAVPGGVPGAALAPACEFPNDRAARDAANPAAPSAAAVVKNDRRVFSIGS